MLRRSGSLPPNNVPSTFPRQENILLPAQITELLVALDASDFSPPPVAASSEGNSSQAILPPDDDVDWGVEFTAPHTPVDPTVRRMVELMIDGNSYVQDHAAKTSAGKFKVRRISVVKMEHHGSTGSRSRFRPKHPWHKDGSSPIITMVYTLFDGEADSLNSPGAYRCGGRVTFSNRASGTVVYGGHAHHKFVYAQAGTTMTYYPRTNGIYVIPGHIVAHSITRIELPGVTRYSIVVFLEPKPILIYRSPRLKNGFLKLKADEYLRLTWAVGFCNVSDPFFCQKCLRAFDNQKQLTNHQHRVKDCVVIRNLKRAADDLL